MITLSHNSSGIFFYVNSTLVASSNSVNAITTNYGESMFGISDPEPGTAFDGNIDELSLWANRTLTEEELVQLYNDGNGITYMNDFSSPIIPSNETELWILNGTDLYTASLNYLVGIGTSNPTTALEVIGNILVSNSISLSNNSLRLGTQDAYGRYQIWNFLPNSVLRLGSLGSDGDAQTVSSEGIVVYGKNAQGETMTSPDFGYARIKPDRIGLYTSQDDIADYYFRVDATSLYLKNNSFTKMFEVTRETGLVNAKSGYSVNSQMGITNNTSFWMCKDSACSTTCQADIKGGIIVGCI